ncbi:sensor histidine kinase KdpD [Actinospica sp. MGRD01-02]|uniref:histidine kinase n=1 Tax=Actinospica acidithermotolerans TaxID=2828514 RepID=A0A941IG65_9ACTN|nr:sensor histidine kinase KdpD [Actinospica acidithermotolerans]MBR7827100.1 sensor histidine kinase KdpD [Actinospica acidithermotolerans]
MSQRGKLRVYLGAAPGVGKTYKMLEEAQRRAGRGADVVIGFVETYGREQTARMTEGLEVVPRLTRVYRGGTFEEMDLDAVLARHPQVALVDELAHSNVPGGRHEKRWQDVQELLDAGIEVITTVNVQHLETLNDVVQRITGVAQLETVPDEVVRAADQIELVDMSPEALRRRLAHGNVYAAEKIDAALGNYFRLGNLTALRELALLWVADRVDEVLQQYREKHGIGRVWEARERVVVALPGGASGDALIRRAARIAARASGGELIAVHIARSDGLSGDTSPTALAAQRHLVETLGGTYHTIIGDDVPRALIEFAQAKNATQLVLGTSRRSRFNRFLTGRGIGETTTMLSGDIDVHMVTHANPARRRRDWVPPNPLRQAAWGSGGRWRGIAIAVIAPPILAAILSAAGHSLSLDVASDILLFLTLTVAIARLGGMVSAFVAALWSSLLLNYYFIPPTHSITIAEANNAIALVVFVIVGLTVASVVDLAIRQTRSAAHASAEAETLNAFAVAVLRGDEAISALLERFRETFSVSSVSLLQRAESDAPRLPDEIDDPSRWTLVAATGADPALSPGGADTVIDAGPNAVLALRGRTLPAADQRVLAAFAAQATAALERRRLAREAASAQTLAAADKMRTALLAAVSHDLRTPLAAAKASISTLRDPELEVPAEDRAELLEAAEESLDRLTRLVENLLDMSRLQAGALKPRLEPVAIEDIVPRAIDDVPDAAGRVRFEPPEPDLPASLVDAPLAERVVANLIGNAVTHTASTVSVTVSALGDQVEVRVIDRGPGIPEADWDRVFRPFQRLGDRDNTSGVGLGLALSRGLAEAMGGTLVPEDTPGGGVTMVLSVPAAPPHQPHPAARDGEAGEGAGSRANIASLSGVTGATSGTSSASDETGGGADGSGVSPTSTGTSANTGTSATSNTNDVREATR